VRLFIGIPMPPDIATPLAAVRTRLERTNDGLRWSSPEAWHVTLQFLGATSPAQHDCVVSYLRTIQSGTVPIQLAGLGFFERSGVFWAGVTPTPELIALQNSVIHATSHCGFQPEDRPYRPHITLARNRSRENGIGILKPRVGMAPEFARFSAVEFLLYESVPSPQGSRYEVRERFPLVGN
jgi:RNA 2',3'-cyclic 3'-phosphodiesterase